MCPTICFFLAFVAGSVSATPLTCNRGFRTSDGTPDPCHTSTFTSNEVGGDSTEPCTVENHTCLTGTFAGGQAAAYGCYASADIEYVQGVIEWFCKLDPNCVAGNPEGVPSDGWTVCSTDGCNKCAAAPFAAVGGIRGLIGIIAGCAGLLATVVSCAIRNKCNKNAGVSA